MSNKNTIKDSIKVLVKFAIQGNPEIEQIYDFSNKKEIRLLYVTPTAISSNNDEQFAVFYFKPSKTDKIYFPNAIGEILPSEVGLPKYPKNWCSIKWCPWKLVYLKNAK
jgi:hypothetical protein